MPTTRCCWSPRTRSIGSVNEDFAVESLAGRRVPARQHLLPHPARRARHGAGRGRARPAADHSFLARRSARAAATNCPPSVSRLRAEIARGCALDRSARSARAGWSRDGRRRRARGGAARSNISRRVVAALGCLPTQDTVVLERFFDEAGGMQLVDPFALRQPHQSRLGPGAAQALLPQVQFRTAGGGDRGQHRAVADARRIVSNWRRGTLPAFRQRPAAAGPGLARRADVRGPLALGWPASRSRCRAFAAARRFRRRSRAWRRRICLPRCSPTRSPAPRTWRARREIPDHPLVNQTIARLPATRRWTSTGLSGCCARLENGRDPGRSRAI